MTGPLFLLEYLVGAPAEERDLTSKGDHGPAQYEGLCFFKSEPPQFPRHCTDNWAKVFAQLEVFRLKSYRLSCHRVKTNNQPEGQLVETGTSRLYPTLLKNNHTIDITRRRNKFLKKSNLSQYVCKNELHLEKSTSLSKLWR